MCFEVVNRGGLLKHELMVPVDEAVSLSMKFHNGAFPSEGVDERPHLPSGVLPHLWYATRTVVH